MKPLNSQEIREVFIEFFQKHDHMLIPGASVVPKNDPTLLFINSGMAPMKKYFLGVEKPPYPRLSNVQACIRTNDIEEVGDRHHLTFFEMMGSWSIGDYYKEKAIELAYDLLVNYFKYPPEKLYATIYKGNPTLNLGQDDEAIRCWEKVGMLSDHIVPLGEDNFWGPAGDTGPCGPCTEVFFDTGDSYGEKYVPGGHFDDVNRYIEIWNAGVFMELNKNKDGKFSPLPMKSVDTGSGIERMYLALNGSDTLYDVDSIYPIYEHVASLLKADDISERDIRMVTDHMRTSTFLLGEGIMPDKEGRGYIPRRLIRKSIACAVRAGQQPSMLEEVANNVIVQIGGWYPHIKKNRDQIINVLTQEINDFTPIIKAGLQMFDNKLVETGLKQMDASFIFNLVTTHGLPFEVINDYALKKGVAIDKEGYQQEYRTHQEISRTGIKGKNRVVDGKDTETMLKNALEGIPPTDFMGYEHLDGEATVIAIVQDGKITQTVKQGEECILVFNTTPFYAESGGQVGDAGAASVNNVAVTITNTTKLNNVFLHSAIVDKGIIAKGDTMHLQVEATRRMAIAKNHTSTHLLHAALRRVLGVHVVQKGSLVNSDKLRFDFLHNKPMTSAEVKQVESIVNKWIQDNYVADISQMNYQVALDKGAMALFSENYGSTVRVVSFDDVSVELCGGIHVHATGDIGLFLVNQETSVAKGIRRIEAVSGQIAYNEIVQSRDLLNSASLLLSTRPDNLIQGIEKLKKDAVVKTDTKKSRQAIATTTLHEEIKRINNGALVFIANMNGNLGDLQQIAEKKITNHDADIVFLTASSEDGPRVLIMVEAKFQNALPANELIQKWISPYGGKGGGKPNLAKGGIKEDIESVELISAVDKILVEYNLTNNGTD